MTAEWRPRLAVYWTAGCGGCETVFLDLGERLLEVFDRFEIVFFPLLVDSRREDVQRFADGAIDLCFVTGAIRSSHDEEMVEELRRVSRHLVALGACAQLGSVLGLANTVPVQTLLETVGIPGQGRQDDDRRVPDVPKLTPAVVPVDHVVRVDAFVPGCPPEHERLWDVIELFATALATGQSLPAPGSVLGAEEVALCQECPRERPAGPLLECVRPHLVQPDGTTCLLDQGLLCSGPATRGGCGALCPAMGAPCRGCYGPLSGVEDQGARMIGALVALGGGAEIVVDEAHLDRRSDRLATSIVDPLGTLYRYSFARSILARLDDSARDMSCDG